MFVRRWQLSKVQGVAILSIFCYYTAFASVAISYMILPNIHICTCDDECKHLFDGMKFSHSILIALHIQDP